MTLFIRILPLSNLVLILHNTTWLYQCDLKFDDIIYKYFPIVLFGSDTTQYNSTVPMWFHIWWHFLYKLSHCAIWFWYYTILLNCTNEISILMTLFIRILPLCNLVLHITNQLYQCDLKFDDIIYKYFPIVLFGSDTTKYNWTVPMWFQIWWICL